MEPEPESAPVAAKAQRPKSEKKLRFLDRMAADATRRESRASAAETEWASVRQTEWVRRQERQVRPTRKALRKFKARQQADVVRRREEKVAMQAAAAALADPNTFFVARRTALRQPPKFEATGQSLEPGESVVTGERRVHGHRVYAETDRGAWIALRQLSAAELRAAAVLQASAMTAELLSGEHGEFAAVKPVAQLMRGLSRPKLASVADAAVLAWEELGDASTEANSSQLIGLPRPPTRAEVEALSRWLIGLGESLTSAVKAGVPYALLGERLPADHKLFKQRQWTSSDLGASTTLLQRGFRIQLDKAFGRSNGPSGEASQTRTTAKLDSSMAASVGGYDEYGDEGFEDDDDDEIDAVGEAANTSAQMGAQAESHQAANFFSRLQRGAVGRVERPAEQSVHKPLDVVDQESRAEEKFAPEIGPSWRKHQLGWERWSLSDDVVARMDSDSKARQDRDRQRKAAADAVEAAVGNAAALSARAEFVCAPQQFYMRKAVAADWNRLIRIRVETAPVASGPMNSTVVSVTSSQTVAEIAAIVAAEMQLAPPPQPQPQSVAMGPAAGEHEADEADAAVWTLARGAEVLDPGCTAVQCGLLPQTTLSLVPAGTKNGGSLRNDFAAARRAHDTWLKRQEKQDGKWKQRAQMRPRRGSAPQLSIGNTEMNAAVLANVQLPPKVKSFLTRVADDAKRREEAAEGRQLNAKIAVAQSAAARFSAASSFRRRPSSVTAQSLRLNKTAHLRAEATEAAAKAAAKAAKQYTGRHRRASSAPRERPPPPAAPAAATTARAAVRTSVAAPSSVRLNRASQLRSLHGAERRKAPPPPVPDAQQQQQEQASGQGKSSWQELALAEEYGGVILDK